MKTRTPRSQGWALTNPLSEATEPATCLSFPGPPLLPRFHE